jgi:hypothetical protein
MLAGLGQTVGGLHGGRPGGGGGGRDSASLTSMAIALLLIRRILPFYVLHVSILSRPLSCPWSHRLPLLRDVGADLKALPRLHSAVAHVQPSRCPRTPPPIISASPPPLLHIPPPLYPRQLARLPVQALGPDPGLVWPSLPPHQPSCPPPRASNCPHSVIVIPRMARLRPRRKSKSVTSPPSAASNVWSGKPRYARHVTPGSMLSIVDYMTI